METCSEPTETYRELIPEVVKEALRYLENLPRRAVRVPAADRELRDLLDTPLPLSPSPAEEVLGELLLGGELGVAPTASGRYFGYVVGGTLPVALAGDWLTSAWDQVPVVYDVSPLAAVLEDVCAGWLVELFGLPSGTAVSFTPSCTYASLLGLNTARHQVLAGHGWDVARQGLHGAPWITVLVNETIHESIPRCLRVLGLGGSIRRLPADEQGRIRADGLAVELERAAGTALVVCGNVGEITTGSCDDLVHLATSVHDAGGWLHLDAAFGLWAAATDRRNTLLSGLELADSWATDAHKWLNVPYDSGIAFIADRAAHREALAMSPDYLHLDDTTVRHGTQWGLAFSRRARVVPIWAVLRNLGKTGVAEMVDRHCDQARRFAERLAKEPGVHVLNEVVLNQVAVRFEHPTRDGDAHTRQVSDLFRRAGVGWASTSRWRDRVVLRLSIINWSTTCDDIDAAAESLVDCHRQLLEEEVTRP